MSYMNSGSRLRLAASTLEANYEAAWAEIPSGPDCYHQSDSLSTALSDSVIRNSGP